MPFNTTPDSFTKLLIHSDTSDGSTTFVDSSDSGHTVTATNANHATTQAKFGDTSIYFDGTGDYISVASHADFTIGTGDYTIDAWVYMSDDGAERFFLSGDGTTQGYFHLSYRGDHSPKEWEIRWYDGSSAQVFTIDHDITINSWHHVAIVFSGGDTISLFYDGVLLEAGSKAYNQPAEGIHVGSLHGYLTSTAGYNGYIDEIRYSKGVARWTSNFTPPTEPYAIRKTSLFSVNAKDGRTLFEIDAEGRGIFPAGHVIQVVSAHNNNPSTISTTNDTWTNSGLNINITPSLASSKILLMFTSGVGYATGESHRQFYRNIAGGGDIALGAGGYGMAVVGAVGGFIPWGLTWIDSPNTTSSTNYSVWYKSDTTSITSYFLWGTSYWEFIAMEIVT